MLNPSYNAETNTLSYEAWSASRKQESVGDIIITNEIGKIGHNYAKWEVVSRIESGDKVKLKAKRVVA